MRVIDSPFVLQRHCLAVGDDHRLAGAGVLGVAAPHLLPGADIHACALPA